MPESKQHKAVKEIFQLKLHEWFGVGLNEYQSSGHKLDAFSVSFSGIAVYVEVIWHHSRNHFLADVNILQQSDADVKVVVASPKIIADKKMNREFLKVVESQRRSGTTMYGEMINGTRVLEDPEYVENDLRELFQSLVSQASNEGDTRQTTIFSQSDREVLNNLRIIIDRPAMHQPFRIEGNMPDFLQAITDIIQALNTGILQKRDGVEILRTKPRNMLSNLKWMKKLETITSEFEELRTRFETAVRKKEMIFRPDGFYAFHSRELPHEIDMKREEIIVLFNELLKEAGLPSVQGIRNSDRFW